MERTHGIHSSTTKHKQCCDGPMLHVMVRKCPSTPLHALGNCLPVHFWAVPDDNWGSVLRGPGLVLTELHFEREQGQQHKCSESFFQLPLGPIGSALCTPAQHSATSNFSPSSSMDSRRNPSLRLNQAPEQAAPKWRGNVIRATCCTTVAGFRSRW